MTEPRVAVVDYGAGNLRSVAKALARSGMEPVVTGDPRKLDRLVLRFQTVVDPGEDVRVKIDHRWERLAGSSSEVRGRLRRRSRPSSGDSSSYRIR